MRGRYRGLRNNNERKNMIHLLVWMALLLVSWRIYRLRMTLLLRMMDEREDHGQEVEWQLLFYLMTACGVWELDNPYFFGVVGYIDTLHRQV
jgi:hypothetical protein